MNEFSPSAVNLLDITEIPKYTRVGIDNSGWLDNTTPLNAANLNKGDKALHDLLEEKIGYLYQLVSVVNNEISARYQDVILLNNNLISEISDRTAADEDLKTTLESTDTKLRQDLDAEILRSKQEEQNISKSIPKSVSQLSNDSNYVTQNSLESKNYVTQTALDSKKYVDEDTFDSAIVSNDEIIIYCGTSLDNIFD